MARAQAGPVVAVKVLVEEEMVAPMGVGLERLGPPVDRPAPAFIAEDFECIEPPGLPQSGIFRGWDAPIRISNIYRGIWDVEVLDYQFWDEDGSDVVWFWIGHHTEYDKLLKRG